MTKTKLAKVLEIVAWVVAIIILVVAILYYHVFSKEEEIKVYKIGETCPNFEISLYKTAGCDGGNYTPKDSRGQVTVLNFWYTTCGPCVEELPEFNEIQIEYGDKVRVIALHSYSIDNEVDKQAFIDETFGNYQMSFGQDTSSFAVFTHLGGKSAYPMTVILDSDGIIQFTRQGKMSKEELKAEIDKLIA